MVTSPRPTYILGLDLGQQHDYSALTLDEIHERGTPESSHRARYLRRWPLRTPYPTIVGDVAALVRRPPLERADVLVIDQTGVGRPVVDMFVQAKLPIHLVPITITAGHHAARQEDGGWHVPKRDLVSTVAVLLQSARVRIAPDLAEAETLRAELENFRTKITAAGNETSGAGEEWREGRNDDLLLTTALACSYGEHGPIPRPFRPAAGGSRPIVDGYRALVRRDMGTPTRPKLELPRLP